MRSCPGDKDVDIFTKPAICFFETWLTTLYLESKVTHYLCIQQIVSWCNVNKSLHCAIVFGVFNSVTWGFTEFTFVQCIYLFTTTKTIGFQLNWILALIQTFIMMSQFWSCFLYRLAIMNAIIILQIGTRVCFLPASFCLHWYQWEQCGIIQFLSYILTIQEGCTMIKVYLW